MMMKMMMKKLFKGQDESHHGDNMGYASPFGNIGQEKGNNKYEMMEQMMKTFMSQRNVSKVYIYSKGRFFNPFKLMM